MVEKPSYQDLEKEIEDLKQVIKEQEANSKQTAISQKRLESLWKISSMYAKEFKEICDFVLEEIVGITESEYGFFGFITENGKEMDLYSWSSSVMKDCAIHTKPYHFQVEKSGIWGNAVRERKAVIYNSYDAEIRNKKGMPEGHVALTNLLSVPVFSIEGEIVALGCVANKQGEYCDEDVNQLTAYLSNAHLILENRKTEEDRKILFEKALSELNILRGILPLCSFCKKIRDDTGYWESVDIYIHKYSQADISHSICPDCMREHYASEYESMMKEKDAK